MGSVFSSPLLWLPCPLRCQLHRRALGSLRSSHLVNPPCSISQSTIVAGRQMPSPQWCSPRSRFCNMTKNMRRKIFVKHESQGVQTIQHHAPHWLAQSFVALIYIYMNHFRQLSSAMRTTYIIQLLIVQNASAWAVWLQVKILHYQTIDYNHLDQSLVRWSLNQISQNTTSDSDGSDQSMLIVEERLHQKLGNIAIAL